MLNRLESKDGERLERNENDRSGRSGRTAAMAVFDPTRTFAPALSCTRKSHKPAGSVATAECREIECLTSPTRAPFAHRSMSSRRTRAPVQQPAARGYRKDLAAEGNCTTPPHGAAS